MFGRVWCTDIHMNIFIKNKPKQDSSRKKDIFGKHLIFKQCFTIKHKV